MVWVVVLDVAGVPLAVLWCAARSNMVVRHGMLHGAGAIWCVHWRRRLSGSTQKDLIPGSMVSAVVLVLFQTCQTCVELGTGRRRAQQFIFHQVGHDMHGHA